MISIAAIVAVFTESIGEATILGYLKGIPQELISAFGIGSEIARLFSIFAFAVMSGNLNNAIFFFPVMLMVGPYILCFGFIDERRMAH